MGLLQDPIKALDQAEWYLDNAGLEQFPGAFELAAGNLCRQTLEQALFILCFFSGMPRNRYLRPNRTLQTAGSLLTALNGEPTRGLKYIGLARRAGPCIRRLARWPRSLARWQRELNEPSHFATRFRAVGERQLREFVRFGRSLLDGNDKYLIVAVANEIFSGGRFRAVLGPEPVNMPGIMATLVVGPSGLRRNKDGVIGLGSPRVKIHVISETEIPRGPWPRNTIVLVQHTAGMSFNAQLVTKHGDPIDLTSAETVIASFAKSEGQRRYVKGHLRRLGFDVHFV